MKRCTACGVEQDLAAFHQHSGRADGRQTVCKGCKRAYNAAYYAATAARHAGVRAVHRANRRARALVEMRVAKSGPCVDCGRRLHPDAMDFDHVRGQKLADGAGMRRLGLGALRAEIAKCDVVCASCHRVRTERRRLAETGGSREI